MKHASPVSEEDPDAVEILNPESTAPILLLCEHAGQAVPHALNGLGLSQTALDGHIGWDIGAGALSRALAHKLNCPVILQRYSRLVIDCNRPPTARQSILEYSDGVRVPGNAELSPEARAARIDRIFRPMDEAISLMFTKSPRHAAFLIHSFTKTFQGKDRPWDAAFLSRKDLKSATAMMKHVVEQAPDLNLAINQPYRISDQSDWFIPEYAEAMNIAHTLIEVRNDHLRSAGDIERWADMLAGSMRQIAERAA